MSRDLKIVFMGTPDFAQVSLQRLIQEKFRVQAVFCQPDKPVGRKQVLTPPAVKVAALQANIPVYQPVSFKKDEQAVQLLAQLQPDVIVVVAYGKILPKAVLNIPKYGCINVHGSLLPKYRGAAPIQQSVIDGLSETGVTTMYMDEGMDTGDIILQSKTKIGEEETAGELFDRLAVLGADLLVETLDLLQRDKELPRIKQNEAEATHVGMLNKNMAKIDFDMPAADIKNLVRGMNPWPVAYTSYHGKRLKVFFADVINQKTDLAPGSVVENNTLMIACKGGQIISLREVLLEGGKRCTQQEFVRGHATQKGDLLGE